MWTFIQFLVAGVENAKIALLSQVRQNLTLSNRPNSFLSNKFKVSSTV